MRVRNDIPPDKVGLFYAALLKIPADDGYQGARLLAFLPHIGTEGSYRVMEWIVQEKDLTGRKFDAEFSRLFSAS